MSARDDMAALYERHLFGEEPGTDRYHSAIEQSRWDLDAVARMATHATTAAVVFAWLCEVGVLQAGDESCDCTQLGEARFALPYGPPWEDKPWVGHFHAAMNHELASEVSA